MEFEVFRGLRAPSFWVTSRPIRVSSILQGGLERRHSVLRKGPRTVKPNLPGSLGRHPAKKIKIS